MSSWATSWAYEQDIKPCGRKAVLVALAHFADAEGFCYPSQELLADMTAQGVSTVRDHLLQLENLGMISRQHRYSKQGKRTSDGFNLQAPPERLNYRRKSAVVEPSRLEQDYRQISAVVPEEKSESVRLSSAEKPAHYRQISASLPPDFGGTYKDEKYIERSVSGDERGYPFDHFAVIEYAQVLNPQPELSVHQAEVVAERVADTPVSRHVWSSTLRLAKGNGYQKRYAGNIVDRYENEMQKIAEGKRDAPIPSAPTETLQQKLQRRGQVL